MSGRNGTDVIDKAVDEMRAEQPAPPATSGRLVSGEVDEFGVLPFGSMTEQDHVNAWANLALTNQRQAEYIGRLQAKVRELQELVDGAKA